MRRRKRRTATNQAEYSHQNGGLTNDYSFQTYENSPHFSPYAIQPKLKIGQPNDKYEQEADAMADKVMRMPDNTIQRAAMSQKEEEEKIQMKAVDTPLKEEEKIQKKAADKPLKEEEMIQKKADDKLLKEEEEKIQMKTAGKGKAPKEEEELLQTKPIMMKSEGGESVAAPALATQLNSTKGSGKSLAPDVNASMSNAFGTDFSHVRVHTDTRATQMNQDLHAKAFTHGSDVYFNQGEYAPTSSQGKKLLAHELTHVVQQGNLKKMIQADFSVEPTTPNRRVRNLTDAQIESAIRFNQAKHTDSAEIALIRDILGISSTPAVIDADFVNAVVRYQSQYGLSRDGKLGAATADRIAQEIIAEADFLGQENLGNLAPEFALKTSLTNLITANNKTYGDYKVAIQGATMIQCHIVLRDRKLLKKIKKKLMWNNWARCIELLGRKAPTYSQLIRNRSVRSALNSAWTASNPAVNPPATTQHEEGGWIYMNLLTGNISVRRSPRGAGASINLAGPPTVTNSIVVGVFHTHPNLGPGWTAGPSPSDIRADTADGIPDIVVGSTDTDPTTFNLFHSGPVRRLHLAGNRGLPSGRLAPQAKVDGSYDER